LSRGRASKEEENVFIFRKCILLPSFFVPQYHLCSCTLTIQASSDSQLPKSARPSFLPSFLRSFPFPFFAILFLPRGGGVAVSQLTLFTTKSKPNLLTLKA
jgi:hypothetical protein